MTRQAPAKPFILIIDDIPANVEALGGVLANDYEVQFALSGIRGLELVRQQPPDLILLDVMMPEMDGYAVFAELARDPKTSKIPVIFVTAYSDADNEARALAAGVVDFIHKPVNPVVVRSRIKLHIALKRHELELERMNAELENRVRERTYELEERTRQVEALNIALQQRAIQAEAANIAKRHFLGNMSHELRAPLNAIIGFTGLLKNQITDPGKLEKLARIAQSSNHLAAIINDIFDFSHIDAGNLIRMTSDFELNTIIKEVSGIIEPGARAKKLSYTTEIDPSIPSILKGDAARLKQVLLNLLGNAVKYTTEGAVNFRVLLNRVSVDNVDLRFEVQDTGIGIEPSKLQSIFEPFEQTDNALTRQFGGMGLGLSINRKLIEMMGGEMGVESQAGQGSTFWATMSFKLGKLQIKAVPTYVPPLEALKAHHAKAKVLLVDDDFITQEIFQEVLGEAGLLVDMANDGEEAVTRIADHSYDLILMDVELPLMDGVDAACKIRSLPGWGETPIIALSGNGYDEVKERCLKAGMNAFLVKPVALETLYQELEKWLEKPKGVSENASYPLWTDSTNEVNDCNPNANPHD